VVSVAAVRVTRRCAARERESLRNAAVGSGGNGYVEGVSQGEMGLRRVQSSADAADAVTLAKEYGEWAVHVARTEYGIDARAESQQGLSTSIEELLQPRGRLYVAEIDQSPVGLGGLNPISEEIAEIKRMYVRPEARGHGVGRMLLQQLVTDARELAFRLVRLESASFMREAHALYRSFGFEDVPPYEGREFADVPGAEEIQVFMALEIPR
jgi:GNAT superfamily N-acetyltransferase